MTWRSFKFAFVAVVLVGLSTAPAVNCMSLFHQMSMQEMACCAQISHDCDMGADHAPCCQSVTDPNAASSILTSQTVHIQGLPLLSELVASLEVAPVISTSPVIDVSNGSPPGALPGSITVLRI